MATLKFSLRGNMLYAKLSVSRGCTPERKTNIVIDPKKWISDTMTVKGNRELTNKILKLNTAIIDRFNEALTSQTIINGEWLSSVINDELRPAKEVAFRSLDHNIYLCDFIDEWIRIRQEKIAKGTKIKESISTLRQHTETNKILK